MELQSWEAWVTLATVVSIAIALVRDIARPDLIFLLSMAVLLVTGIITPREAFAGFASPAVIAVGSLFVVAAGIEETGVLRRLDRLLFGAGVRLYRLMLPVSFLSSFINDTPIVAMLMQPVQRWALRRGLSPSKVLIPLSYAAITGGMVTLIGTSTNVIISSLLVEQGHGSLGLFDLAWTGLPAVIVVTVFMSTIGVRLLPSRVLPSTKKARKKLPEWAFEVRVARRAPIDGRTIARADLEHPGEADLVHVRRGDFIYAPEPTRRLQTGDVLAFNGGVAALEELLRRPGLEPCAPIQAGKTLPLYEAVVSDTSYLIGKTLREVHFFERYGAVVLAVQRKAERSDGPLGSIRIKAGDLLLVGAPEGYLERWNASSAEFYYVAARGSSGKDHSLHKTYTALATLLLMIFCIGTRLVPLTAAAFSAAMVMIVSGCLTMDRARRALDLQVLMLIAGAFGVGQAVVNTGLTDGLAETILALTGGGIILVFVGLYIFTNVLTELITHKAAAVLMLPVAVALAESLGVEAKAFAIIIAVSAAASFMTPVGYQTNLMVMSLGQYRVRDYLRVGVPVSLLVMVATITAIYFRWV